MSVHHIGLEAIHHIAQSSNEPGVRNRRRKRTLGVDVNAWQDGRPLLEPMNDDPVLGQESTALIGLGRSRRDEAWSGAVECQHRLLFGVLIGINRLDGRATASPMASASAASFLFILT